jgi:Ca2+/H+ antiporter
MTLADANFPARSAAGWQKVLNVLPFLLLAGVPLSWIGHLRGWDPNLIFLCAALAVVALAKFTGQATEEIAALTGPMIGGLVNATFGNATELILGLVALRAGLVEVVKASITGAIISNLLLVAEMDLSFSVALGSTMQIALFVAPLLVLAGSLLGQPMNFNFGPVELVAIAVSVLLVNSVTSDGRSNWLEGLLLLATYAILGIAFFFLE